MKKELTLKEALDILENHEDILGGHDDYWEAYRFIEKQLKALEIIKEKKVDIAYLIACVSYDTYKYLFSRGLKYLLTKEEFNFLREALK